MKKFLIGGTIIDDSAQAWAVEDVTPSQVKSALSHLSEGDGIDFEITSAGGSCSAGLAIANLIREASAEGHRTKAHVIGLAASMASVIACACDEIEMDESSFLMIHNPWTQADGDAGQLRKEADVLDKFKNAILAIYRTKFNLTDAQISELMDKETWFTGAEAQTIGFNCSVIPNAKPLKMAACARRIPSFTNCPVPAEKLMKLGSHEGDDMTDDTTSTPTDESVETITKAEADSRVQGMQSVMAKQMDALRKDYEAKITDLTNQLKERSEELTQAQARVTSLESDLEKTNVELQETASALVEKTNALATLNSEVNSPAEEVPTFKDGLAKCRTPKDKLDFIKSGRYTIN